MNLLNNQDLLILAALIKSCEIIVSDGVLVRLRCIAKVAICNNQQINLTTSLDKHSSTSITYIFSNFLNCIVNMNVPNDPPLLYLYSRRCTLLIGCLFCGSWKRKFLLQVHTRRILVGCRYHDYCWIW